MSEIADSSSALRLLKEATDGLLYPSESEEPFAVIRLPYPIAVPAAADLCKLTGLESSTLVKESDLERVFAALTADAAWHGEEEKKSVERYRMLRSIFTGRLTETRVFRLGEVSVHLFIIGKTSDGMWVGVKTVTVET